MATEIRRIDLNTAVRFGIVLGVVGGVIGLVPIVWAGLQYEWYRVPFGVIVLDALVAVVVAAVGTAFGVAVFVVVYNVVAKYVGGVEITLSK